MHKQFRGKVVFAPFISADDLEPIVREFASMGYSGEGMTTTLSQGLYSIVIRGGNPDTIVSDISHVCKGRDDIGVHYSVTSVFTHAKGQSLKEFMDSYKEDWNGYR